MGDFNAQVGKEDNIKQVAGKYTMHENNWLEAVIIQI
jgi:hypothetical protein